MPPKEKSKLPASLDLSETILPLLGIINKLSYIAEYLHHLSAKCSKKYEEYDFYVNVQSHFDVDGIRICENATSKQA
jgi:hypothetical protein